MSGINELISRCIECDAAAQEQMYQQFAPKMWVVCLRFARNKMAAEDLMQEGFVRMFSQLHNYKNRGSFEGWIRRVFVNTAINHYKKYYQHSKTEKDIDELYDIKAEESNAVDKISAKELLLLLNTLPAGYRVVFNLYAVEGYTHREIATILGCSESTSKSQLSRARIFLQNELKMKYNITSAYERTT